MGDLELEYAEMMVDKGKCEKWQWYIFELQKKSEGFLRQIMHVLKSEESIWLVEESEASEHFKHEPVDMKQQSVQVDVKMEKKKIQTEDIKVLAKVEEALNETTIENYEQLLQQELQPDPETLDKQEQAFEESQLIRDELEHNNQLEAQQEELEQIGTEEIGQALEELDQNQL